MNSQKMRVFFILFSLMILFGGSQPAASATENPTTLTPTGISAGSNLGSEMQLSPDGSGSRYQPQVAYNSYRHEYLVVWHNTWPGGQRDIYARRITANGEVLPWFSVASGFGPGGDGHNRLQPAVAYNASIDQYLVVWMYEASANVYEIHGKVIPYNSPGTNPEFTIIQWANRSFWSPRVVWNSTAANEYFVAWNAMDTTTGFPPGTPNDIAGHRVSKEGVVQNPGSPIILSTVNRPYEVDVVFHPAWNEYLVTWTRYDDATTQNNIYTARFNTAGTLVDPPGVLPVVTLEKSQHSPAAAVNGLWRYCIVWEEDYAADDHDIYAREYTANLDPLGGIYGIATWGDNDTAPKIGAYIFSQEWFVAWQRDLGSDTSAIIGYRYGNGIHSYLIEVANFAFWENEAPAVAIESPGVLIVYEGDSTTTDRHIYGRLWWAERTWLPLVLRGP